MVKSLSDWTGLIEAIKKAALDAVNATKPVAVLFGKVVSASPLKINVEQKMTLEGAQLILTRNVTDHPTLGGLKNGDEVILIRMQGGQQFLVIDRLG